MKNKLFRQGLIAVQQNTSCDNHSSLLDTITTLRVRSTIYHYTMLALIRNKTKRIVNDASGRGEVCGYVTIALERCKERGLLCDTPPLPKYDIITIPAENPRLLECVTTRASYIPPPERSVWIYEGVYNDK